MKQLKDCPYFQSTFQHCVNQGKLLELEAGEINNLYDIDLYDFSLGEWQMTAVLFGNTKALVVSVKQHNVAFVKMDFSFTDSDPAKVGHTFHACAAPDILDAMDEQGNVSLITLSSQ